MALIRTYEAAIEEAEKIVLMLGRCADWAVLRKEHDGSRWWLDWNKDGEWHFAAWSGETEAEAHAEVKAWQSEGSYVFDMTEETFIDPGFYLQLTHDARGDAA